MSERTMPTREVIGAEAGEDKDEPASVSRWVRRRRGLTAIVLAVMAVLSLLLWFMSAMQPNSERSEMQHGSDTLLPPAVVITDMAYLSDDTMAILMLLRRRTLDIKGFVTTAGNVDAARSAADLRKLFGELSILLPVVEGPGMAWHRDRLHYFADVERQREPAPAYAGALSHAVANLPVTPAARAGEARSAEDAGVEFRGADFLSRIAKDNSGRLIVVLLGPATVVAQALDCDPLLKDNIARIFAMGGSIDSPGNVTPAAEFNVWFDPPAMERVLASDIAMTLVPLDATSKVGYPPDFAASVGTGDPASQAISDYLAARGYPERRASTWDEVLAAILIEPSLISRSQNMTLGVSMERNRSYGQLLRLDPPKSMGRTPVQVVLETDSDGVRRLMSDAIGRGWR